MLISSYKTINIGWLHNQYSSYNPFLKLLCDPKNKFSIDSVRKLNKRGVEGICRNARFCIGEPLIISFTGTPRPSQTENIGAFNHGLCAS